MATTLTRPSRLIPVTVLGHCYISANDDYPTNARLTLLTSPKQPKPDLNMCRTRSITYNCQHSNPVRLSTCRGTYITQATRKRPPRAACYSAASLAVRSLQPCGSCQRAAIEERHTKLISDLKAADPGSWTPSIELVEAEAEWEIQSFHLTRQYPERRFEKFARPEHGQRATPLRIPGPSPLRQEVQPEDVPEDAHAWTSGGWEADWGSGWPTLGDELAEQEAEKTEDVKAYEAMLASDYLAWAEDRPSENFIDGAEIDEQSYEDKEEEEAEADVADVKTAIADVEELPSDVFDTMSATREAENIRPAKAITFELRRHPKAMSMRRKASGEYETDEAKWTCFSLWMMVS
ncbi:hypothetical protein LTR56_026862 [Elasticomyces elasticus]|nr:hypothetical protein LTR56_026862 [Elasticomyces elasticus]KAK3623152.1 hypothetical protein LTR22_024515 [Elasticomyces elasticus]KAK4927941.1 hypothetical protein LTR49_005363 [Elasticomyces elasticus]KAK5738095.1 hypothetical protein LTS12_025702 [Elasticomyces elasticus]